MSFDWVKDVRDPYIEPAINDAEAVLSAVFKFATPFLQTAAKQGAADALADIQAVLPVYQATEGTSGQKLDAAWVVLEPKLTAQGIALSEATALAMIQAAVAAPAAAS